MSIGSTPINLFTKRVDAGELPMWSHLGKLDKALVDWQIDDW